MDALKIEGNRMNLVFAIVSDNFNWTKTNFNKNGLAQFLQSKRKPLANINKLMQRSHFEYMVNVNSRETVLCFLTLTDHIILTVGSFGWFGAYLNELKRQQNSFDPKSNPIVTYYKHPFRENSPMLLLFSSEDYFPEHWIPMVD